MEYKLTSELNTEVLLFVHGLGASLRQFEKQHFYFAEKYKVISVSLFDGESSTPVDYSLK